MSEGLSLRRYAASQRERGLSGGTHEAVRRAAAAGRITLHDGKVDPAEADRDWSANTLHRQKLSDEEVAALVGSDNLDDNLGDLEALSDEVADLLDGLEPAK